MNKDLAKQLEIAIRAYNAKQEDEAMHLDWWEVLDAIADIEHDGCVIDMITDIYAEIE